ncbi:MAG: NADPH-dependent oxidoreductase, partial [Mesorhizobium sp.]
MPLTAFALNCSLKASNDREKSSTDRLLADVLAALMQYEVKG